MVRCMVANQRSTVGSSSSAAASRVVASGPAACTVPRPFGARTASAARALARLVLTAEPTPRLRLARLFSLRRKQRTALASPQNVQAVQGPGHSNIEQLGVERCLSVGAIVRAHHQN